MHIKHNVGLFRSVLEEFRRKGRVSIKLYGCKHQFIICHLTCVTTGKLKKNTPTDKMEIKSILTTIQRKLNDMIIITLDSIKN
jgi:hypothetical protein